MKHGENVGQRAAEAATEAHEAEERGDDTAAGEAWRRYRLRRDAGRSAEDLLDEGIALSTMALSLTIE